MSEQTGTNQGGFIERWAKRIPDPILLFMAFFVIAFVASVLLGGHSFESMGAGGELQTYSIRSMAEAEQVRWIFDNALLTNWLGFGGGVLGVILVVILAIGIAEQSGLLSALIKRMALLVPQSLLPLLLVLLGILSSLATDAGYLILIPLAGMLYAGMGKNPLIGMAAAFAGVSAGFSANLVPGTPIDVIIGVNAQAFAEAQGVPFANAAGEPLQAATMHYWFIATSTFVLAATGALVTRWFVQPRLERQSFVVPADLGLGEFALSPEERRGLVGAGIGLLVAAALIAGLILGPLAAFENAEGRRIVPYMNNVILLISLFFACVGLGFGIGAGTFKRAQDAVNAMVKQMNTIGYILVLTFFAYNFLGLLTYSGLGAWITYLGGQALLALSLDESPVLLLIGFVLATATINLFIGGLTSKWMLLGPIFIPMLYFVSPEMTPDLVSAAYRVADSATNVVSPMMMYAGIILAFMRRYRPELSFGEMLLMMVPYSAAFLVVWTTLLVGFYVFGIPLGF
ncbi:AbgT family transporter [uncultured Aquimonas sp.]|uniref:AbgT family transporter n=1 Tax=uncultured Aquimonas sp. TaxID=385483 RepID=UPI00086A5620|nr:AbgT family transporter [uncultured Aquimonas sp.]ODU45213.1 MAG: aminobenzoyl-glutamate transporter [Xanthomonadaceae bacterium SCN 69-123]